MRMKHGRRRDGIKEPILGQGKDEDGQKRLSLGALIISLNAYVTLCPLILKDRNSINWALNYHEPM